MALAKTIDLDLQYIQRIFNIPQKRMDNIYNKKLDTELKKIYLDYQFSIPKTLETVKSEVLAELNKQLVGKVHSIRCRIKDRDHLIEKIIRNVSANPDKYQNINENNYYKIITDLIGIRIIILNKRDWFEIHQSLLNIFRNLPDRYADKPEDIIVNYDKYENEANVEGQELENSYHAEKPVVYITSEDDRKIYQDSNLKVDNSKTHYRSIHYIVRYGSIYFEIQVRTLFEEGWLEFDHRIKYPHDQDNKKKNEFVSILNSLATSADRLISLYDDIDFKQECDEIDEEDATQQEVNGVSKSDAETLNGKMRLQF